MFSPFDFDVCTSPEEQEEALRRTQKPAEAPALSAPAPAERTRPGKGVPGAGGGGE